MHLLFPWLHLLPKGNHDHPRFNCSYISPLFTYAYKRSYYEFGFSILNMDLIHLAALADNVIVFTTPYHFKPRSGGRNKVKWCGCVRLNMLPCRCNCIPDSTSNFCRTEGERQMCEYGVIRYIRLLRLCKCLL